MLIRTLVECTTHIEFVLSARDEVGTLEPAAEKYVQEFFADYARNDATDFRRAQVKQKMVHEVLGAELDRFAQEHNPEYQGVSAETYSRTYLTFSNYVHAKYPETMRSLQLTRRWRKADSNPRSRREGRSGLPRQPGSLQRSCKLGPAGTDQAIGIRGGHLHDAILADGDMPA